MAIRCKIFLVGTGYNVNKEIIIIILMTSGCNREDLGRVHALRDIST